MPYALDAAVACRLAASARLLAVPEPLQLVTAGRSTQSEIEAINKR